MNKSNTKISIDVSRNTIIVNILLFVFKLLAGIFGKSSAMVSDSIHSLSDVLSTFVVIIGVKISAKEADKKHPYGHERFECVAAIILSIMLLATGVTIGYSGVSRIISIDTTIIAIPSAITLIAAIVSIVVKEGMYHYAKNIAKKVNSGALMADAWHHRSDAFSSVGSLIAIFASRLGFPILDNVASIIICFFIIKTAVEIFIDSINKMTDTSCNQELYDEIYQSIISHSDIIKVDLLQTRMFGNKIYVDIEITLNRNLSLYKSHLIAHDLHDSLEKSFPNIKHCMIHVNPSDESITNFIQ